MVETCCHIKRYSVIEIVNGENNKFILQCYCGHNDVFMLAIRGFSLQ